MVDRASKAALGSVALGVLVLALNTLPTCSPAVWPSTPMQCTPPPYPLDLPSRRRFYSHAMQVLGTLLLLIGLMLGFVPGSAEASPCPFHSHMHDAATG